MRNANLMWSDDSRRHWMPSLKRSAVTYEAPASFEITGAYLCSPDAISEEPILSSHWSAPGQCTNHVRRLKGWHNLWNLSLWFIIRLILPSITEIMILESAILPKPAFHSWKRIWRLKPLCYLFWSKACRLFLYQTCLLLISPFLIVHCFEGN